MANRYGAAFMLESCECSQVSYPHKQGCTCKGCDLSRRYVVLDAEYSVVSDDLHNYFTELVRSTLNSGNPAEARSITGTIPDVVTKMICMDWILRYEKQHPAAEGGA